LLILFYARLERGLRFREEEREEVGRGESGEEERREEFYSGL